MATVTDSSLLTAAQQIVTDFMDGTASLNDGVIKKASELSLNTDQTQRLIERTNTEAFLRVYPNDTEFDVASPEVVLGIKTASIVPKVNAPVATEGLFKAASVNTPTKVASVRGGMPTGGSESYQARLDAMTEADIFGMDEEFFKTAAATKYEDAIDHESLRMCQSICNMTKTASELAQEQLVREERLNNAVDAIVDFVKQASLSGRQSIESSEGELMNMYPEHMGIISELYDGIVTKMACEGVNPDLLERSKYNGVQKWAHRSELTDKFDKVLQALK